MRYFGIFIFILLSFPVFPQHYLRLSGVIKEQKNRYPLPFASVGLKDGTIGTITNQKGLFVLKVPASAKNDSIICSFLGYKKKYIPIQQLINQHDTIWLKPDFYRIAEINVKAINPEKILLQAIENIPENYPDTACNLNAFYREEIKENGNHIQLIESVIGIYKGAYQEKRDNDQLKIIKGREKKDVSASYLWDYIHFVNGPYEMIRADIAKNPFDFLTVSQNYVNFLKERHFKYYVYKLKETKNLKDNRLLIVEFSPKYNKPQAIYTGKLYIDKKTLAFQSLEFTVAADRIDKLRLTDSQTLAHLYEIPVLMEPVNFKCIIDYKKIKDKWFFSNAIIYYNFLFLDKPNSRISTISVNQTLSITQIAQQPARRFKWWKTLQYQQPLDEQIGDMDEQFWENYNFVPLRLDNRTLKE